jgi:flagellar biosynthesis/type III secretory pathway protein FliH
LSDVLKLRSKQSGLKIVRAVNALPRIFPTAPGAGKPQNNQRPDGGGCEKEMTESHMPGQSKDSLLHTEYRRGLVDGQRQAEETLRSEMESKLQAEREKIDKLLSSTAEQLSGLYRSSEEAIVKFAFGIAERVIRKEVIADRSMVLGQIHEGLRRVLGVENVKVRVHPGDLPLVREQKSVIQAGGDSIREMIVEGDESLEPGDCVIESDMGTIDARISTQLKQIENVLFESKVVTQ